MSFFIGSITSSNW